MDRSIDLSIKLFVFQDVLGQVYKSFDDMNLKDELLRGIYAFGFENPSAIQQKAIVPCIKGMYMEYLHRYLVAPTMRVERSTEMY